MSKPNQSTGKGRIMRKQILHVMAVLLALAAVLGAWTVAALAEETPAVSVGYYSLSHEDGKYYIQYAVKYEGFDVTGANTGMLFWTENPGRNPEKGSEDAVRPNLGFTEIDGGTYYVLSTMIWRSNSCAMSFMRALMRWSTADIITVM